MLIYFRSDVARLWRAFFAHLRSGVATSDSRLAWAIVYATVPVSLIGLAFRDDIERLTRDPLVIAGTTIVFGILLWFADRFGPRFRDLDELRFRDVAVVGLMQALALVPGTSRSGITMTAALAMGLTRQAAARFSFLLAIPVIGLAAGYESVSLWRQAAPVDWSGLAIVAVGSGLSALACIAVFLKFLDRIGFSAFVIYRIILGVVLIALFM